MITTVAAVVVIYYLFSIAQHSTAPERTINSSLYAQSLPTGLNISSYFCFASMDLKPTGEASPRFDPFTEARSDAPRQTIFFNIASSFFVFFWREGEWGASAYSEPTSLRNKSTRNIYFQTIFGSWKHHTSSILLLLYLFV